MTQEQQDAITDIRNRLAYFEQPFESLFAPNLDGSAMFVSIRQLQTIMAMLPQVEQVSA